VLCYELDFGEARREVPGAGRQGQAARPSRRGTPPRAPAASAGGPRRFS
jgi:hypothetical protein